MHISLNHTGSIPPSPPLDICMYYAPRATWPIRQCSLSPDRPQEQGIVTGQFDWSPREQRRLVIVLTKSVNFGNTTPPLELWPCACVYCIFNYRYPGIAKGGKPSPLCIWSRDVIDAVRSMGSFLFCSNKNEIAMHRLRALTAQS